MRSSVSCTSLTTSTPSTTSERLRGIRSATWSTARSSETLMCSPANIASRRSSTPRSRASSPSSSSVSSVIRFFEKSRWRPAPSATRRSPRSGSAAKRSRRWVPRICSKWRLQLRPGGRLPQRRRLAHPAATPRWEAIDFSSSSQDLLKLSLPSSWRRVGERGDVDPGLLELLQDLLGVAAVGRHQVADLAVVGEGEQGRLRHRVDREGRGEGLDVEGVGGVRVLGPGAGPEQPLRRGRPRSSGAASGRSRAARGRRGRRGRRPRCRAGCAARRGPRRRRRRPSGS